MLAFMRTNNQINKQANNQPNKQSSRSKPQPQIANGQPSKLAKPVSINAVDKQTNKLSENSTDLQLDDRITKPLPDQIIDHAPNEKHVVRSMDAVVDTVSSPRQKLQKSSADQSNGIACTVLPTTRAEHHTMSASNRSANHSPVINQPANQHVLADESNARKRKPKVKVNPKKNPHSVNQLNTESHNNAVSGSASDVPHERIPINRSNAAVSSSLDHRIPKQSSSQSTTSLNNPVKPRHPRQSAKQTNKSSNPSTRPGRIAVRANSCDLPTRPVTQYDQPDSQHSNTQSIQQSLYHSHNQANGQRTCLPSGEMECKEIDPASRPTTQPCAINPPLIKRTLQIKHANNQPIKSRSLNSSPINRFTRTISNSGNRSHSQLLPKSSPITAPHSHTILPLIPSQQNDKSVSVIDLASLRLDDTDSQLHLNHRSSNQQLDNLTINSSNRRKKHRERKPLDLSVTTSATTLDPKVQAIETSDANTSVKMAIADVSETLQQSPESLQQSLGASDAPQQSLDASVSDSSAVTDSTHVVDGPSIDISDHPSIPLISHRLMDQSVNQTINHTIYSNDLYNSPLSNFSLDSSSTPSTPSTDRSAHHSNDHSLDQHDSDSLSDDEYFHEAAHEPELSINRVLNQSVPHSRHSDELTYSIFGAHIAPQQYDHSLQTSQNQSTNHSNNHSPRAESSPDLSNPSITHSIVQNEFSSLHYQILQVSRLMGPNSIDTVKRRQVLQRVATVIFNEWEPSLLHSVVDNSDATNRQSFNETAGVELHVIGSCATDLFLPDSDIDLVVRLPSRNQPNSGSSVSSQSNSITQDLHSLGAALQSISSSIQIISTASVPLIKLVDQLTGFTVDLTLNIDTGLYSTSLVLRYLDLFDRQGIMNGFHGSFNPSRSIDLSCPPHPILRPLTIVLKQFLKARGLNDLYSGGLPSYALILMIVAFLQWHIKCKINDRTLVQLYDRRILSHSVSSDRLTTQLSHQSEQRKRSSSQSESTQRSNDTTGDEPGVRNTNYLNRTSVNSILQQPVDQPVNTMHDGSCPDLGHYLLAFLDFYGNHFPYHKVGISLLDPSATQFSSIEQLINQPIHPGQIRFFHKSSRGWSHAHAPHLLCFESPLDSRSDVGFKVFRIAEVKAAFSQAHAMLSGEEESALNSSAKAAGLTSNVTESIIAAADFADSEPPTPITPLSANMTVPIMMHQPINSTLGQPSLNQTFNHLHSRTMTPSPPLLHYPRSVPSSPHQPGNQSTNQYQHHPMTRNRSFSTLKEDTQPHPQTHSQPHSQPVFNQHNVHHNVITPVPVNQFPSQPYYHQYQSQQQYHYSHTQPLMVPPFYPAHHSSSPMPIPYYQPSPNQSFNQSTHQQRANTSKLNKLRPQRTQSQHQSYVTSQSSSPSVHIHQPRSAFSPPRRKREHRQSDTDLTQLRNQQSS